MTNIVLASPTVERKPWPLRYLWPLLAALLILRLLVDARFTLAPDEAVYWQWSRHLSLSYFDHPPLIAWVNWLFTQGLGSTELSVRLPATLLALGTVAVIAMTAQRIMTQEQAAWVVVMWLISPLMVGLATISTPDTPTIFFSTCALACALLIARHDDLQPDRKRADAFLWLAFGLFCGLGLLSKYTAILVPAAVCISLALSPPGRRHLARPWIYLAAMVALVVFSPVLWWNYRHQWASFAFQLHHGTTGDPPTEPLSFALRLLLAARNIGLFLGGQALLWTPILFILGLTIICQQVGRVYLLGEIDRLLLCSAVLPLLLFGWASSRRLGELNWPCFAYVPMSLMTGRWLSGPDMAVRTHWVREGCKLALIFLLALHLLFIPGLGRAAAFVHLTLPRGAREVLNSDRRATGRALAEAADGALVVCNRHQDTAVAQFYMPGQPQTWCDGVGFRPTAFDYFEPRPDFARIPRVLFVGGHVAQFMAKHGYTHGRLVTITRSPDADPRTAVMVSR